ncbi:MAG: hypothetical protein ACI8P3_003300 [Saprospiraceae bacterium]|jgi:hypothetical protein
MLGVWASSRKLTFFCLDKAQKPELCLSIMRIFEPKYKRKNGFCRPDAELLTCSYILYTLKFYFTLPWISI